MSGVEQPAATTRGRLVLVPNALDLGTGAEVPLTDVLPEGLLRRAAGLGHWVVENAKTTRAFLKRVHAVVPLSQPLQTLDIRELPRPAKGGGGRPDVPTAAWQALLAPARAGHDIGLLSEAGLPAVADPGAALVALAHDEGLDVEPWSGPSSLTLALAASGLGGQNVAFVGYLPVEPGARTARIRELEAASRRLGQTQLAIETPYRNTACFEALLAALQPGTRLSVACGLTVPGGWVRTASVARWRTAPPVFGDKLPAVFAWLA